ncbi:autotransporter secretion inner membrane protein TamB [Stella humosa]|uniref:Autotransporter secretion inner membrane protein TamB n=1 Tax=Stella humosa TaxID=94 RepID=A0A3N1LHY4_9PROT|nr:translocation/assembly module TamB domain-containing protein [Stella humosa]ROP91147.1 autotransporter secretion inner membrane protein TamB [Stella humosa]BBK34501.1 translocation/assembly module TamB [Stella humosa]
MWWLRRTFGAAIVFVLLALVLAGGLFGMAQTRLGRDWIAGQIASAASQPGSTVAIERIDGLIPFTMEVRGLSVSDEAGPWLAIDRMKIDWLASEILSRRLRLGLMEADLIRLERLPATPPAADTAAPAGPPGLPQLPVTLSLDKLRIGRLEIGPAVAGQPLALAVEGAASLASDRAEGSLSIRQLDGEQGAIDLSFAFSPAENRLEAKLEASEPSGKLGDRLLGRADSRPVRLTLDGTGPLDGWKGRLVGIAGDEVGVDIALTVNGLGPYRIAADGVVQMKPLLPPQWQGLAADGLRLSVAVTAAEDGTRLDSLHATLGDLALSGRGRLGADGTVSARLDATVIDLAPIGTAAGQAVGGAATITAEIAGTTKAPTLALTVDGTAIAAAGAAAEALSVRANIRPDGERFAIAAEGSIAGAELDGAPAPVRDARWSFAGIVGTDGRAAIDRLSITTADGSLEAAGTADPAGAIDLRLSGNVAADPLQRLGAPVHGPVTLTGHLRGDAATLVVGGDIAIEMRDPRGEPALAALLGDRLRLSVTVARTADGAIRATALRADGAHVRLEGSGGLATDGTIDARATLALSRLDVLSQPLATPLAGTLSIDAAIAGSLDRPTANLRLASPALTAGGRRWSKLAMAVDGRREGAGFAGRVQGGLEADGVPVTLSAAVAHDGATRIAVDDLQVVAAGQRLTGNAVLADGQPVSAAAKLDAPDLARLAPLLGMAAGGSLTLDARLARTGRNTRLTAEAAGRNLVMAANRVGTATLRAAIDEPLTTPRGTLALQLRGLAAGGQVIDEAALEASGDLAREIRATLTARAAKPRPIAADLAATITRDRQAIAVALTRGKVTIDRQELTVASPLRVRLDQGTVVAEGIDIRLDQGRVTGNARYAATGVTGQLAIQQLSLASLGRLADIRGMQGQIGGEVRIDTESRQPNGNLTLRASGIRWRGTPRNLPPLTIEANGRWQDGRATLSASLRDVPDAALAIEAALPLQLAARPLAFAVPPDGALSGRADGNADLARIRAYLPVETLSMSGRLEAALRLDGTVADPRPGGRASLTGARIEEGTSGLVLANLRAAVVGDGNRFRLEGLSATDGAGGRIEGSGTAERGNAGWGGDAAITVQRFRVLANDLGRAIASGRIEARSGADGARIGGRIQIDQGDLTLPSSKPTALTPLPVVEVNRADGTSTAAPAAGATAMPVNLGIDVSIPGRLFVRGRGLDSEWRGDLRVAGTLDTPQVTGSIRTVRGRYDLLGRRFTVERGVISFDGAPTDARLDLLATAVANQLRATVTVSGSAMQPTLVLGSDPPLPQDEVLAQILFGRSTTQVTPGQAVQLAQAAAELAGIGSGSGLVDRVRQSLGLDALDIGGDTGTSVSFGRYITDDVFVKVNPNPGENASVVGVEIQVLPNVTVDAGVGSGGTSLGLKYRFDY